MRKFEVGDVVRVVSERPDGKEDYIEWFGSMDVCLGSIGKIDRIDSLGNVSLAGVEWWLHPKWIEIATSSLESDPINHPAHYAGSNSLTGGLSNYYLSRVEFPQREDQPAYTAECEDLIESLRLNPDEANIFKEIWRSANARLGNGKPDHKALYGAEKINHYAGRNLRRVKREAQK